MAPNIKDRTMIYKTISIKEKAVIALIGIFSLYIYYFALVYITNKSFISIMLLTLACSAITVFIAYIATLFLSNYRITDKI